MADTDLLELRNKMKRDPQSYVDELQLQLRHFHSIVDVFKLNPGASQPRFGEVVSLLSHVTPSYPNELRGFPQNLLALVEEYQETMETAARRAVVQSLILLRNRRCLEPSQILPLFFKLFRCPDKDLRSILSSHIVSDVTNMNLKHKDNKLNRLLQNFMFTMLQDHHATAAKKSLGVLVKLYKKKIWDDEKTVNVIASACFSPEASVRIAAMHFFLGIEDAEMNGTEDEDMPVQPILDETLCKGSAKKSRQRAKRLKKAAASVKRKEKRSVAPPTPRFAALQLLNDPDGFSEKLLSLLRRCNDGFDAKLVIINLLSRVIATHQIVLINFYPFVQRYIQAHQKNITNILAYVSQSVHNQIPPDVVAPVIRTIADNFISDGRANEIIAIGLNAVREICARQPLAMDQTLLQDLTQYKSFKDKGVIMAARSLMLLYRQVDPKLLRRKDMGRKTTLVSHHMGEYGAQQVSAGVDGIEFLGKEYDDEDDAEMEEFDGELEEVEGGDSDEEGEEGDSDEEEDDGEDGELEEVEGDSEDEEEGEEEEEEEEAEEMTNPDGTPMRMDAQRLLTQEDFERIAARRQQKKVEAEAGLSAHKRKMSESLPTGEVGDRVDPDSLQAFVKRPRKTKEERLVSVLEGRQGRQHWKEKHANDGSHGTTNKEKLKKKAFAMIKKSRHVREKSKRSIDDIQKSRNGKTKQFRGHMGGKNPRH